jgi:hypothetical protein
MSGNFQVLSNNDARDAVVLMLIIAIAELSLFLPRSAGMDLDAVLGRDRAHGSVSLVAIEPTMLTPASPECPRR